MSGKQTQTKEKGQSWTKSEFCWFALSPMLFLVALFAWPIWNGNLFDVFLFTFGLPVGITLIHKRADFWFALGFVILFAWTINIAGYTKAYPVEGTPFKPVISWLKAMDWGNGWWVIQTLLVVSLSIAFIGAARSRRVLLGFTTGLTALWILGSGPAYLYRGSHSASAWVIKDVPGKVTDTMVAASMGLPDREHKATQPESDATACEPSEAIEDAILKAAVRGRMITAEAYKDGSGASPPIMGQEYSVVVVDFIDEPVDWYYVNGEGLYECRHEGHDPKWVKGSFRDPCHCLAGDLNRTPNSAFPLNPDRWKKRYPLSTSVLRVNGGIGIPIENGVDRQVFILKRAGEITITYNFPFGTGNWCNDNSYGRRRFLIRVLPPDALSEAARS